MQGADVGMVQRRDGPRLALGSFAELLGGDLDGDVPSDAGIARAIDLAHAAGADLRDDFVRAEFVTSRERHQSQSTPSLRAQQHSRIDAGRTARRGERERA